MSTEGISEEEMAGLTEEERAALMDDDEDTGGEDTGEDENEAKNEAKDDDKDGDKDESKDDTKAADESNDDDNDADADDDAGKDEEAAADDDNDGDEVVDYDEKITGLDTEMDKVASDLDEGDITIAEYHKEMKRINGELTDLKIEKAQIAITEKNNAKVARDSWERDQNSFFEDEENNMYLTSKTRYDALNMEVKNIASEAKFQNATGLQVLKEADKRIREAFTMRVVGEEDKDTNKGKGDKPKKKRAAIPQTLGGKPSADKDDTGKGEFDDLDALEGMDFEKAIAKMSPEEQDRYARG